MRVIMTDEEVRYSVVVPVYNSQETLNILYGRIVNTLEVYKKHFEIIFVDDGSIDSSWEKIRMISMGDNRVSGIQLMRNFGQANATICSLRHSEGKWVITIDDDLQNPPEEMSKLIDTMENNPDLDVVIGKPIDKKHNLLRTLGSDLLNYISSYIFTKGKVINLTSFRIITRSVVEQLLHIQAPHLATGALLCSITPRIKNIPVKHKPRISGKSGYSLSKLYRLSLSKFLSYSTFPLRFLAIAGIFGIFFSVFLAMFYFFRYLSGGVGVAGWTTLVLLIVGLAGFNFFAFGIIGEYLLRIMQSVYGMPQYQIRQYIVKNGKQRFASVEKPF